MISKTPGASGHPFTDDRSRRATDAREGAQLGESIESQKRIHVLSNSIIIERGDHAKVETPRETFTRPPLDDTTRTAIQVVGR